MAGRGRLILTLDAFGTLFKPKQPISRQYAELAWRHGLSDIAEEQIRQNFKRAFHRAQHDYPNYGRKVGMGASKWWSHVILATFDPGQSSAGLPPRLVPDLLSRFSTSEAYELYPDVLGFFHFLSRLKSRELASPWTDIIIGIITNSDDRVPSILTSLGLRVGSTRISTNSQPLKQIYQKGDDINFVVMSYDVGVEKPDHRIFDAAKALANATPTAETSQDVFMHVGDDLEKDSMGATNAGWKGLYLGGFGRMDAQAGDSRGPFVEDLRQLEQYLRPGAD